MRVEGRVECRWKQVLQDGKVKTVPDHELGGLARVVLKEAKLEDATPSELDVLGRLSAFVVFAGRHPIATKAGDAALGVFPRQDFKVAEQLLNRLTKVLNPAP